MLYLLKTITFLSLTCLKTGFVLANSADLVEMPSYAAFHQDLLYFL